MQLIVFKLKEHFYGFTTENIEEITTTLHETSIPQGPAWTKGLINLRGQIMTLVDLERLLNGSTTSQELWYNNTIIVNTQDNPVAFMVGKVVGVTDIQTDQIQMMNEDTDTLVSGYVFAYNEMVSIIDLETILIEKEEVS
ncbi:purine-binding chemotaxis protein CheW [Alkalibacterium putridalgicola]|uniref:Chemotaxis protein CheW n=1 Tax=Alkalibacterium putridalgicola TaxID=426703 RepID=A0A1H7RDP2_9LACT|nr:chemotaxis protein CheW [Alkalibacterium putridalgicola]GEK88805.1 chemotaxis protein CheW [Alkalibacterium putridalgicola]SEL58189.1 purine-binding chemotaxis protein CheW [Alkalibacterium putridalgicola]